MELDMKKMLFCSTKGDVEITCPNYLWGAFNLIAKHLKVKPLKLKRGRGQHFKSVIYDEFGELK